MNKTDILLECIKDKRCKRVVFLAHCILNENTRYLGGACRHSCVTEILDQCCEHHIGIIQMPCPEQLAWGGVLKRLLLMAYGVKGAYLYCARNILIPFILLYTNLIYHRVAKQTTRQILDYLASGFTVIGIVGIDGSPTCGINKTLDFKKAFEVLAYIRIDSVTTRVANRVVLECLKGGNGLFIRSLQKQLNKRKIELPLYAHDLVSEIEGKSSNVSLHERGKATCQT